MGQHCAKNIVPFGTIGPQDCPIWDNATPRIVPFGTKGPRIVQDSQMC